MNTHPLLERAAKRGVRLGLQRMDAFLRAIGSPHTCAPVVHVAGTNGKGSVCAFVTEALVRQGYVVGTTVSPHVERLNERIQIDGCPLDDAGLTWALDRVQECGDRWAREQGIEGDALTYFESMLAAAFLTFAERGVDVQVVEVGLGGSLDATNVVVPTVTAITQVGLDHQQVLGNDVASIAEQKAGIIKQGAPVVTGPLTSQAMDVVRRVAHAADASLRVPTATTTTEGRCVVTWDGRSSEPVTLGLAGDHQAHNAAVAVGVLWALDEAGIPVSDAAIAEGLARARVPARMEWVSKDVLVDGAHNVMGAEALSAVLHRERPQGGWTLLFGLGGERDGAEVAAPLLDVVDRVVTTHGTHPHATPAAKLAKQLAGCHRDVVCGGPVERALPLARRGDGAVVVAGSLFVGGAVRCLLSS